MIAIGKKSHSDLRRRPIKVLDDVFHKGEWMETTTGPGLSPTVFLAEQPPHFELLTHFHKQNQFQLFVEGEGALGKETVGPVTVHYAGAYTGYGPLVSGAKGLKYFTIRSIFDTGMILASEAREKMIRGPKRHAQATLGVPWTAERLKALTETQCLDVMPAERGLCASHLRLPPEASWTAEGIAQSVGQFVFVLSGSAQVQGNALQVWESAFVSSAEVALPVTAGPDGAEIVVLHMPDTEPEYRLEQDAAKAH